MLRRSNKRKFSKKELRAQRKHDTDTPTEVVSVPAKTRSQVKIEIPRLITVAELANLSSRTPAEIVGALMRNGVLATVNDSIDRETVEIIADELDLEIHAESQVVPSMQKISGKAQSETRPPVVVVMGHVDHGKTTLLDAIRKTNTVASEAGGITQHIGAYQVQWTDNQDQIRPITFIDTPGHEAFSAMRAHGATITDVAILVVAADDGVKPQTKEAMSHAKAANIPIIIALNKIDKKEANPDRVKGELAELGLAPEDWGGKTPLVRISAKHSQGIDDLLDVVLLVADLQDLRAQTQGQAEGIVIEANKQQGVGPVATVLVQSGELKIGDAIVLGPIFGKIRVMENERGQRYTKAGPSTPVRIAGLSGVPAFGEHLKVCQNEKEARQLAQKAGLKKRLKHVTHQSQETEKERSLAIIVKADVDGSLKAIKTSLEAIEIPDVEVKVILEGVGDVTESDINIGTSLGQPYIVAFRTGATVAARHLARTNNIEIHSYDVIYRLIEDVQKSAEHLHLPIQILTEIGRLKVLKIFRTTKTHQILGGRIEQGRIVKSARVTILREKEILGTGIIESVQKGQEAVAELHAGEECGLGISTTETIQIDDVLVIELAEKA
ncbi:translation initiation factor IF-2 [Candidatus Berkelbacteria bacterium]|nr:translation initiation factor IF-2 [Candidatus Berkelbacteria bacterium]